MMRFLILFLLYTSVESFLNPYPKISVGEYHGDDVGEPLYLTQYVENGNIEEGRRLARVPFTEEHGIKSYAGFFTVNKEFSSNHFFWYFPSMTNEKEAPVLVWLQGGPGSSSLFGLFMMHGPIRVTKDEKFEKRELTWTRNHHVIYIDNPVGTGFSFTNSTEGYCKDEVQVGDQLYSTMIQFFQLFPDLQLNDFYITGESYAGKYVPALGYAIHKRNSEAKLKINLKGLAIGNGFSDPINQLLYGELTYQLGLVDWNQMDILEKKRLIAVNDIKNENWTNAESSIMELITSVANFSQVNIYNHQSINKSNKDSDYTPMLRKAFVRKGIHVGKLIYNNGSNTRKNLIEDIPQSVAPWISELLELYEVVVYNGQLDIIVGYPLTVNYLRNLNFSGAEEYKTAERHVWMVDDDVAGYVKKSGNLVEIMVRNAGHMVPLDQPKWAWNMITMITHHCLEQRNEHIVSISEKENL